MRCRLAALAVPALCLAASLEAQEDRSRAGLAAAVHAGLGLPGALGAGAEIEYRGWDRFSLVADGSYWLLGAACELADGTRCPPTGWSVAGGARLRLVRNFPLVPYVVALVGPGALSDGTRGAFILGGFGAEWPATRPVALRVEFQGHGLTGGWAGFPGVAMGVRVGRPHRDRPRRRRAARPAGRRGAPQGPSARAAAAAAPRRSSRPASV